MQDGDEDLLATMKCIVVSYIPYDNWMYQTTGQLFQDLFRIESVETNRSFLTVISTFTKIL